MTDFFKSALGLFGQNQSASGPNNMGMAGPGSTATINSSMRSSNSNNDFVGQNIMIGNIKLRVTRMLAEGGYAIVYITQDLSTGIEYALKVKKIIFLKMHLSN
jgi:hypothetical protein